MVLEVINSSLSHNLPGNPHLLYSLLYQHEMFEDFRLHPAFNDIISNIEMVGWQNAFNSEIIDENQIPIITTINLSSLSVNYLLLFLQAEMW